MEFLSVIAAAIGTFAFGAVWYITLSKPWIEASGIATGPDGRPKGGGSAMVVGFLVLLIVAGMMRHLLATSGIDTVGAGAVAGFGIGAFLITPWVVMNYAYGQRSLRLMIIDGAYSTIGCTIMGAILTLI